MDFSNRTTSFDSFPLKMSPPSSPTYPPLSPRDFMDGPLGPYVRSFYSPFSLYIDQDAAARAWLREQYLCSLSQTEKSASFHQYPSFGVQAENQGFVEPKPQVPDEAALVHNCRSCLGVAKRPAVTSGGDVYCWQCLFEPVRNGEVTECVILPHHEDRSSDESEVTTTDADTDAADAGAATATGFVMEHGSDLEGGNAREVAMEQEVSHVAQVRPRRKRNNPRWMSDYICC